MAKRTRKNNPGRKKKSSMQTAFTRYMLIVAIFIVWIAAIGVRLVHLQVNQHEWLLEKALNQRSYEHKSTMLRGTIFDRNERTLAMSIKVKSLYADPTEISDIEYTAKRIADILKVKPAEIINDLKAGKEKEKRFVWLARKVDEEQYQEINKILVDSSIKKYDLPKFAGLHWREEQKRSYPYKNLASTVIGFTNSEHLGLAGIEMSQEGVLKGEAISSLIERDRLGRVYDETELTREPPKDVVLTISNSIQYKAEEALISGIKKSRAKSGKVIVLDPKNGEILAMANYPSFDPNEFQKLDPDEFKNRVIQDNYSPGSVFKLITYSAALEEHLIEPDEMIDCGNGTITVGGHTFRDSHSIGTVSYTKAFAQSSNVGAIKTGQEVGKDKFYSYARKFGFGKKTGIKLPAETGGILRSPDKWNGDSLASMSIGYEIGVTALQSASAFAIIANDGEKVQPHIIKEIRQSNGKTVSAIEPEREQIVSAETARDLRKMLRQVVLNGTAKTAQLSGYTSAGKTGTAWKYDPKLKAINRNKYVSSFIGFAPADNPRVVIAVVIDEPQGAFRYGGQVAGPIFREIAEQVLPELNVRPDGTMPGEFSIDDEIFDDISDEEKDLGETTVAENKDDADTKEESKNINKEKIVTTKKVKPEKSEKKDQKKDSPEDKPKAAEKKNLIDKKSRKGKDEKT